MRLSPHLDLTYCTNIHPGESLPEVRANIATHAVALKQQLSPTGPFALGLRLSAAAAEDLLTASNLADFKSLLDGHGLYVALLNGFPFGSFNCGVVKSEVFSPDWRQPARVDYTLNLIRILAHLLPENMDGGISTMPLSYKPWLTGPADQPWNQIAANLVPIASALVRLRRDTGKLIHLDIEPEPDGLVENTAEIVHLFTGPITQIAAPLLAGVLGVSLAEATRHLFDHIRVCFDTCHLSVEYEDPLASFHTLAEHGIAIGRIQVSSALHARFDQALDLRDLLLTQLQPFAESIYLHQVIERTTARTLRQYRDLTEALALPLPATAAEWRIHYHVPIFTPHYGDLTSNQQTNRDVLAAAARSPITPHLEIETYTWDVLPAALKIDLLPSMAREYRWVLDELASFSRLSSP